MKYVHNRIHIKPEDYLGQFEEYDENSPSYINYYTQAFGPYEGQEMSDTVYHANDEVPYHEHCRGVELFLVDRGSVDCWIDGKRVRADKGDMVFIPPYVAHGFRYLEDRTIWRELFQEIQMNEGILSAHRLRYYYPERFNDPEFMESFNRRGGTVWFNYDLLLTDADKNDVPYIRTYDFAINRFDFDGISLLHKLAKHETNSNIEVWQLRMDKGFNLSWNESNPHDNLFVIYSGSVDVKIDNMDPFVANERDILRIPTHLGGAITTREDTVLLDYNCRGNLLRALHEIKSRQSTAPKEKTKSEFKPVASTHAEGETSVDEIFNNCDYFIRFNPF